VQVREHDMADVGWCVSKPYHLPYRGLVWVQNGFGEDQEGISERLTGMPDVAQPESRLDEHQTLGGLDQQTVTDHVLWR